MPIARVFPFVFSSYFTIIEPIRMSLPKSDLDQIIYYMCSGNGVGLQKYQNNVIISASTSKQFFWSVYHKNDRIKSNLTYRKVRSIWTFAKLHKFRQSKSKVSFCVQCTMMQLIQELITLQNFSVQSCFSQFLWFVSLKCVSLKCWFKGQIISKIHLSLPNACKLMCFNRNINRNRAVKVLECDYLLVQCWVKLTLRAYCPNTYIYILWVKQR